MASSRTAESSPARRFEEQLKDTDWPPRVGLSSIVDNCNKTNLTNENTLFIDKKSTNEVYAILISSDYVPLCEESFFLQFFCINAKESILTSEILENSRGGNILIFILVI